MGGLFLFIVLFVSFIVLVSESDRTEEDERLYKSAGRY